MIYCLLYHRTLGNFRCTTPSSILKKHLLYLKDRYSFSYPGEALSLKKTQICLTFDDAYADFYYTVFPMLKKFNIPCVLAVPTGFIQPGSQESKSKRLLALESQINSALPSYGYCSWKELKEMHDSGLVKIASHSHSHINLKETSHLIEKELLPSKQLIHKFIGIDPEIFVYPFGSFSPNIHKKVKKQFKYIFRIGSCANLNWEQQTLYRICCDGKNDLSTIFTLRSKAFYLGRHLLNTARFR